MSRQGMMVNEPIRRKVFISHYKGDRTAVDAFLKKWGEERKVFIARALNGGLGVIHFGRGV